ncbi:MULTISPECIES: FixH family protein [unclassified Flavobacterium]|uniref:FixH family protein n=1 Tax=unclassified Flavobacterium TaxID=196869 RepID=UPI000EAB6DAD|nr:MULTISPECIES: FixH family protein [unclassified Flavobacterium]RKS02285.1 FixH protein [Flavobacterium sp. 102]
MKINWGKGIVIAIALFMGFILYFVVKVQSDSQYDNEMVTEQYYKKEKLVQGNIESIQNANNLTEKVAIDKNAAGVTVNFPKNLDYSKIKGKVSLYRPSNQKLDFEIPISLSGFDLLIPKNNLVDGLWGITVAWEYEGKSYLNKEEIYF